MQAGFNRAAATYDVAAFLAQEIGQRLLDRLDYLRWQPQVMLDVGAGTGDVSRLLQKRYPYGQLVVVDYAHSMLLRQTAPAVCAAAEQLPLAAGSVDLVFSNLMLPWCPDHAAVFAEVARVLRPGGLWLFSTLGPETLSELQMIWSEVDTAPHVHEHLDLHTVGDLLLAAHFEDPVVDREIMTVTYRTSQQLWHDLRATGGCNLREDRRATLTGKRRWQEFVRRFEATRGAAGKLITRWEVLYGHAWRPEVTRYANGEVGIPISAIRRLRS